MISKLLEWDASVARVRGRHDKDVGVNDTRQERGAARAVPGPRGKLRRMVGADQLIRSAHHRAKWQARVLIENTLERPRKGASARSVARDLEANASARAAGQERKRTMGRRGGYVA